MLAVKQDTVRILARINAVWLVLQRIYWLDNISCFPINSRMYGRQMRCILTGQVANYLLFTAKRSDFVAEWSSPALGPRSANDQEKTPAEGNQDQRELTTKGNCFLDIRCAWSALHGVEAMVTSFKYTLCLLQVANCTGNDCLLFKITARAEPLMA